MRTSKLFLYAAVFVASIAGLAHGALKVAQPFNGGTVANQTTFSSTVTTNGGLVVGGGASVVSSTQTSLTIQVNGLSPIVIYGSSFTVNTASFTVQTSGLVGIGTTNPTQLLTIGGGSAAQNNILVVSTGTTNAQLILGSNAQSAGYVLMGSASNHPVAFAGNNSIRANMTAGGQWNLGSSAAAGTFIQLQLSTGTFKNAQYTTTQLNLMTASVGEEVFNSTLVMPCFSSGTAIASFVRTNSPTTACR